MGFIIREAIPEDNSQIFRFVCDLAEYEKMPGEVTATEDILYESLFIKRTAEVLMAELDGEAIGFALFFHNFSTFKGRACLYLEDIFIKPEYRGKGYGTEIFRRLAGIAVDRECDRFDWWVLDWNEPSIGFYKGLGAIAMDEWTTYRLQGDNLRRVAGV